MIIPFEERLKRIKDENPRDLQTEGQLAYEGRIFSLVEYELFEFAHNHWRTYTDKLEALIQIMKYLRTKNYHVTK